VCERWAVYYKDITCVETSRGISWESLVKKALTSNGLIDGFSVFISWDLETPSNQQHVILSN